jgi:tetratricopeptide (TPR) repeat protein
LAGFILAPLVLLAGCVSTGIDKSVSTRVSEPVELADTPFFPQQQYHCGPAALATVLGASAVDVLPNDLVNEIYLPKRKGSLQIELLATTRRHGRIPYPLEPDPAHIVDELNAGRPVLVLQNLGLKIRPWWHYAVIVGFEPDNDVFILRSGTNERLKLSTRRFLRTWRRAGAWSFVALKPSETPAHVEEEKYLKAIVAMERLNKPDVLIEAYPRLLERWPDNRIAQLGLANAYYVDGQHETAALTYTHLLDANPNHIPARNNLAMALSKLNCLESALTQSETALALAIKTNEYVKDAEGTQKKIMQLKNNLSPQTQKNPLCQKLDLQLDAN